MSFNGVLIEPCIDMFNKLLHNRPNAKKYNYAIDNEYTDSIFVGGGACGGLEKTISEKHVKQFFGENPGKKTVKCVPIKHVIDDSCLKYIDLFILDVEGGELTVLETLDFNIPIYVFLIELDGNNLEKDQQCRDILIKNGFSFNIRVNINEFWINTNYFRKDKLYNKNIQKLNFFNMWQFGNIPFLDMNHHNINQLRDALLL